MALRSSLRISPMATGERWRLERVPHPELPLLIATDGDGTLVAVHLGLDSRDLEAFASGHGAALVAGAAAAPGARPPSVAARQLAEYLEGRRRTFDVPLRLFGSPFQRAVWEALQTIPFGETRSYGDLAIALGRPGGARAVGQANGANALPVVVPCHRVIAAGGGLGGFSSGLGHKRWLLDHEAAQDGLPLGG